MNWMNWTSIALSERKKSVHNGRALHQGQEDLRFIRQMSEISWIHSATKHRAGLYTRKLQTSGAVINRHLLHVNELNYFMEEPDLREIRGNRVDGRKWPSREASIIVSEAYFCAVAETFPFIHRTTFIHRLGKFPRIKSVLTPSESRWLTAANLVWATGTKMAAVGQVRPIC
jgi:hypothetical protein